MKFSTLLLSIALLQSSLHLTSAQEGSTTYITTPGTSAYACDSSLCKIENNCLCATKSPPGGLSAEDTPQFVTITFDDSVQDGLSKTARSMLNVINPNGCPGHGTWFVSIEYTDFSLVQQWYADGHEIADHTFSHVGSPSSQEIMSCKAALSAYGGVPSNKIQGFRAPFLNYTKETLKSVSELGFTYDSSTSAVTEDVFWPYTLNHGVANDCWSGICAVGEVTLPGLWEIPMYAVLGKADVPQLMDVYLYGTSEEVKTWTLDAFNRHYNGNRQPFGIYVHPTHLTAYPQMADRSEQLEAVLESIRTIASRPNVWFVTNEQLLKYMKNPVKASELGKQDYMMCKQPKISQEVCNGLDDDYNGTVDDDLVNTCNFGTSSTKSCFNCPSVAPTVSNPTPPSTIQNGTTGYRYPAPESCDTIWWDPINNACLCTSSSCEYKNLAVDTTKTSSTNIKNDSSSGSRTMAPFSLCTLFASLVVAYFYSI
ncbi:hypothetical protein BDB01DRAFT_908592 [Pilobolus umbonatus]|nr:hypothetical protein BDB01DRAFT_908592 [Pilobolus umbonatus]